MICNTLPSLREGRENTIQFYGKTERLTKTHAAASSEAVTEANRAGSGLSSKACEKDFPDDGIIGEENETGSTITFDVKNTGGRIWVIDPIDGTNNFIAGLGMFCVCIGLLDAGQPVLGVVYDVTRNQLYCAATGKGAWLGRGLADEAQPIPDNFISFKNFTI